MKKLLSILMAACILATPTFSMAQENNEHSKDEKVEIRDQNIYVPTKDGIQRATYEEAIKIDEYNKKPLSEITDSYLLGDYKTGKILQSDNIDEVRAMASTSKLVSVFVVMDKIKEGKLNLDDKIVIDHECSSLMGSSYKLKEGNEVTVENLLKATFIVSGNDAITALGKQIAGSKEGFVNMMNKKCKELGLEHAHMVNATGLTDYGIEDYNKMTTREMFKLTCALLREHPEVLKYSSEKSITLANTDKVEYNTNPILGILPEIDGLKTGYTNAAGRCLVATGLKKGNEEKTTKDMRLIGITMGSSNNWKRYSAARRLMENGFNNYSNVRIGNTDEIIDEVSIEGCSKDKMDVFLKKPVYILKKKGDKIEKDISIKENLKAPLDEGTKVGEIKYYIDDEEVASMDLIIREKAYEKGFIFKFQSICEGIFSNIKESVSK